MSSISGIRCLPLLLWLQFALLIQRNFLSLQDHNFVVITRTFVITAEVKKISSNYVPTMECRIRKYAMVVRASDLEHLFLKNVIPDVDKRRCYFPKKYKSSDFLI